MNPAEWILYRGVIAVARTTGAWRYPIRASGDLETMGLADKIYWAYKARFPVERAQRQSGLERFFNEQNALSEFALPEGFHAEDTLQLRAVGDLMTHPFLSNSKGWLYEKVQDAIFGCHLTLANLECVVDPDATSAFEIRSNTAPALCYSASDFAAASGLDGHRYSAMSLANNHILDRGEAGIARTVEMLRTHDIAFHGVNETEAQVEAATILETNGFKVGVVSHTFGLNGRTPPPDRPWLVNRTALNCASTHVDFGTFQRQFDYCRLHGADAVVALLHWGMEHEYYPRPEQLTVAHHLAEIGADLIIGHHPHVEQPVEYYRTVRDSERVVPVYYSLGNLLTPFTHPAFRMSALADVTFVRGTRRDGKRRAYVTRATTTPLFQEIDMSRQRIQLVSAASGAGACAGG